MNAQFAIKARELAAPIRATRAGGGRLADDGTAALFCCKSEVRPKDLEPPDAAHFAAISLANEVPAGRYLFLQVIYAKSAIRLSAQSYTFTFAAKSFIAAGMPMPCGHTSRQAPQAMHAEGCFSFGSAESPIGAIKPPCVKTCSL